jgi:rsbT co-antagonist protein RsbR
MNAPTEPVYPIYETDKTESEKLLDFFEISSSDINHIKSFGEIIKPDINKLIKLFYDWLETQPVYAQFFSDPETLNRVQKLQCNYWKTFFGGNVNDGYIKERKSIGEAHARIGLPLQTYLGGMNFWFKIISQVLQDSDYKEEGRIATMNAIVKLLNLDTTIVADTYSEMVRDTILAQSKSLMEMSTPVTQIWSGILLLPVVGIIDSKRARDIMNTTLEKIALNQSRVFILDISGVAVVDTAVANHLVKITKATSLMGCESIISGVSPAIAQTIVELGIDVGTVKTTGNMMDALSDAFGKTGMKILEDC